MSTASLEDFLASINRYQSKAQQNPNKGGFFDQLAGGFQPAVTPEQLLQFERLQNYQNNPNRVVGVAGQGGEMLGNAIAGLVNQHFANKNPQVAATQAPFADPQGLILDQFKQNLAKGQTPGEAMYNAGTWATTQNDPSTMQYGARALKAANDLFQYNPNTKDTRKTADVMNGDELVKQFPSAKGATNANDLYSVTRNADGSVSGYNLVEKNSSSTNINLSGDYEGTKSTLAKDITDFRDAAINADRAAQNIDQLKANIAQIPESTGYTGKYVGLVNNVVSTVSGLANAALTNVDTAKNFTQFINDDVPSKFEGIAVKAGVNKAMFNKISYMVALANSSGSSKNISDKDFNYAQEQTGAMLSDPKVASAVLDQLRNDLINDIHTKAEYSTDILSAPSAQAIYNTFSSKYPIAKKTTSTPTPSQDEIDAVYKKYGISK